MDYPPERMSEEEFERFARLRPIFLASLLREARRARESEAAR